MNENYLAYEALVTSRESLTWAMIGVVVSIISACASVATAAAAISALNVWKAQERAHEWKNLNVAVFRYQSAMNTSPELIERKKLEPLPFQNLMRLFDALDNVYECTLGFHEENMRIEASNLYTELVEIHQSYTSGQLNRSDAIKVIVDLRLSNKLLNSPH